MRPEEFYSPHFTLAELTASHAARTHNLDNTPSPEAVECLQRLCTRVLEPLRADLCAFTHLDLPLIVTSGYRSDAVNRAVGGSYQSAHLFGRAADVVCTSRAFTRTLLGIALARIGDLPIDQLIAERTDEHGAPSWIHIAWARQPRHQFLKT